MREGLLVKYHPGRLSDDDLMLAAERSLEAFDHAPRTAAWLLDGVQNEQLRRLRERSGEICEAELMVLRAAEWPATDLMQGLSMVTAMSYAESSEQLGELVDLLVRMFTCAVGSRAVVLEKMIYARLEARN